MTLPAHRTWTRIRATAGERAFMHRAAELAGVSLNELILASTKTRLAKDLAAGLPPAPTPTNKVGIAIYSNLTPDERAQLAQAAAAAHQSLSEYMLHATITDAHALLDRTP